VTKAALAILLAGVCVGCAAPEVRTTFLGSIDLVEMTDRMADSFAADPVIGRRSESSETWVVSIDRVVNHTNQIIPGREKWLYTTRLRARLAESNLTRRCNIIWVVPPERWPAAAGEFESEHPRMLPTHLLAAEFQTLTQTSAAGRSDTYVCAFQLTDLGNGRLVWEDLWEVKYAVRGLTWN
jgi:PBP1b-binding outer membrane lipoprotein LpoB